ncbi:MAG: major capsid protein [Roseburia sp.]|nr:major capsid protein [Roseburia sp.]
MDISKIIETKVFSEYWRAQTPLTYFGESKFRNVKQRGSELKYIKGAEQAPVVMSLTSNDANSIGLSYGEFELIKEKIPLFKNHYTVDEDLIELLLDIDANATDAIKSVVAKIFSRADKLRKNAALTREVLRMQALTTGVASMKNNGNAFTVDYKIPSAHKVTPTVKWSVTSTADPISNIEDWQLLAKNDAGESAVEILMNSKTLGDLRKVETIRTGYFANSNAVGLPTSKQVKQYLMDSLDSEIFIDDDQYKDIDGTVKKMVPDGTVVLMPTGYLGDGVFGTTAEEARLPETEVVDMGVALKAWNKDDPVASYLKASQRFLPSFERANGIIIASVL